MIAPDELQRRIEKSLSESQFSKAEIALRRASHMIRDGKNGVLKEANSLLTEAGFDIKADALIELIDKKPWLLETLVTDASGKKNGTGH